MRRRSGQLTNRGADRKGLDFRDVSNHLEIHDTGILPRGVDHGTYGIRSSNCRARRSIQFRPLLLARSPAATKSALAWSR